MSGEPNVFCVVVEGDSSDDDYTGVTKRVTPTGAEYRIVGPLAAAIARALDEAKAEGKRKEREQCAKIAELFLLSEVYGTAAQDVSFWVSDAIRARGEKNEWYCGEVTGGR